MEKTRVLVDLKIAMNNGYCGIGSENRLIFNMLSSQSRLETSGLLISDHPSTVFARYQHTSPIEQSNYFFHQALGHKPLLKEAILTKLKLHQLLAFKRKKFNLFSIPTLFNDTIWRNIFDKTLTAQDKVAVLNNDFYFSNLTNHHLRTASYFNYSTHLNTSNFDFALFLEPQPISVSPNTIKIVRFHDAIPISDPDFASTNFSHGKMNILNQCAKDAYFVCNSEPSLNALLTIKPELEKKATIIPCVITHHGKKVDDFTTLKQILEVRLNKTFLNDDQALTVKQQIQSLNKLDYFFHLATFDPKKNQLNLIKAWEKIYYQSQGKIKLVLAANPNWMSEEFKNFILPHLQLGNIILLSYVSNSDAIYLHSHAIAFVFPSYVEGFGLPPLEAMQCGCPTIISDIPAHRWVAGDAALYCNPYDPESITEAMQQLMPKEQTQSLRHALITKGYERVQRYLPPTLNQAWENLFSTIKAKGSIK